MRKKSNRHKGLASFRNAFRNLYMREEWEIIIQSIVEYDNFFITMIGFKFNQG